MRAFTPPEGRFPAHKLRFKGKRVSAPGFSPVTPRACSKGADWKHTRVSDGLKTNERYRKRRKTRPTEMEYLRGSIVPAVRFPPLRCAFPATARSFSAIHQAGDRTQESARRSERRNSLTDRLRCACFCVCAVRFTHLFV